MPLKCPSNEIQYKLGEFIQRHNPLPQPRSIIHKKTLGREICSYITTAMVDVHRHQKFSIVSLQVFQGEAIFNDFEKI